MAVGYGMWGTCGSALHPDLLLKAGISQETENDSSDGDDNDDQPGSAGRRCQDLMQRELRRLARAIISVLPLHVGKKLLNGEPVNQNLSHSGSSVTATLIQRDCYQQPYGHSSDDESDVSEGRVWDVYVTY